MRGLWMPIVQGSPVQLKVSDYGVCGELLTALVGSIRLKIELSKIFLHITTQNRNER